MNTRHVLLTIAAAVVGVSRLQRAPGRHHRRSPPAARARISAALPPDLLCGGGLLLRWARSGRSP